MLELKLVFRSRPSGAYEAAVPGAARAVFAGIGVLLVAGALSGGLPGSVSGYFAALGPAGCVALGLMVLAALYEERWTFDPAAKEVVYRFGLVFLAMKRRVSFDEIESVAVESFVKGQRPGSKAMDELADENARGRGPGFFRRRVYRTLALNLKDGTRLSVETLGEKKAAALEAAAKAVSEMTGASLAG